MSDEPPLEEYAIMHVVTKTPKVNTAGHTAPIEGRTKTAPERLEQLDSLRGLAAASVVFGHVLVTFPEVEPLAWKQQNWFLWFSPVHALFSGGEAVMFFFVLSGFVLSLPYYKSTVAPSTFLIKRLFRIYPAYWCAISAAFIARGLTSGIRDVPDLSYWFDRIWSNEVTPGFVVHQYFLLGSFDNGKLIPVVWSLVQEMRISLLFPLLMAVLLKWPWRRALGLGVGLFFAGHIAGFASRSINLDQDYTDTLFYIPLFMVGATLARYRYELVEYWRSLKPSTRILALFGALMSYTYSWWCLPLNRLMHLGHIPDMAATVLGCSVFIVAALGSGRIQRVLCSGPLTTLGALSYSVFLFHALVWVVLVRVAGGIVPYVVLFALLIMITLGISWVVYRGVEQPFIKLGKRLTGQKRAISEAHRV